MQTGDATTEPSDGSASTDGTTSSVDGGGSGACTRDSLSAAITTYFTALAAHDPTKAPLDSSVKYTENGATVTVGMGEWKTAGAVMFKRSALDTDQCETVTEAVIADMPSEHIYGLRLKLVNQKITEIESIIVLGTGSGVGDYITDNPAGLVGSSMDDWETPIPASEQSTREHLEGMMDLYFTHFPSGACDFASDCMRLEDGQSIGSCTGAGVGCVDSGAAGGFGMSARHHVVDVAAGISVGFTMFVGEYTDFHMFKVRSGMVHGVHAELAMAANKMSGWPMQP